jgi:hypothetical protein
VRRACELADLDRRSDPTATLLDAARRAQQAPSAAEAELRELLLHDEHLIADEKWRWGDVVEPRPAHLRYRNVLRRTVTGRR